jgi:putative transposase
MHPQRADSPGLVHFVTYSTFHRRRLLDTEPTRNIVVETLQKSLSSHGGKCVGFVVMPNHVHALVYGDEAFRISLFMQAWKKTSSYRIKQFLQREMKPYVGYLHAEDPVWLPRFYDFLVDSDEKLNEKLEYMHSNPVEAGLAEKASAWKWSSAPFYERGEPVGVGIAI